MKDYYNREKVNFYLAFLLFFEYLEMQNFPFTFSLQWYVTEGIYLIHRTLESFTS